MNTVVLSTHFSGLNRAVAKHLLGESDSPDTKDSAPANEVFGILGARRGIKRTFTTGFLTTGGQLVTTNGVQVTSGANSNIVGVVPFDTAVRGRVVADAAGNWTPVGTPWPGDSVAPRLPGYDFFDLSTSVQSTGSTGTYYSTTQSMGVDLSAYAKVVVNFGVSLVSSSKLVFCLRSVDIGGIDLLINGVWTNILTLYGDGTTPSVLSQLPATGIVTGTRSFLVDNFGGGFPLATSLAYAQLFCITKSVSERTVVTV